jgi:hypothetical protein
MPRAALCLVLLIGLSTVSTAVGQQTGTVIVTVQIPAKLDSFEDRALEVQLFEADSRAADKPSWQIEKYFQPIRHKTGKNTTQIISLGAKAAINPELRYYVTTFVLDAAGQRTHIAERDGKTGLCYVLTDGNPAKVVMIARDAR